MDCAYCGKPATAIDLCHASHPVCDAHKGIGHQLAPAPKPQPVKRVARK